MKILVINSGSSSIKFKLFDMSDESVICKGLIEQIGQANSGVKITNVKTGANVQRSMPITNHGFGIDMMNFLLFEVGALQSLADIAAVGHRVVQGADVFKSAVLVDTDVLRKIEALIPLAPLHNLASISGIRECQRVSPQIPNVAVFDTVFHQSMPPEAYMYALPWELYENHKIRRYGAHGTSHEYVSKQAAKLLGKDENELNAISLHIGSGASVCAIKGGKCVDTSMGLTPLEGLMMGTRSGDMDPAIVTFLLEYTRYTPAEIDAIMNKKSGLIAIAGTNDMRDIHQKVSEGDAKASLALAMHVRRVKKYIGAYHAIIGQIDCIIFTAGIGENDAKWRAAVCEGLEIFGIEIDKVKNEQNSHENRDISKDDSKIKILVIPTDEELAIAQKTKETIEK